MIEVELPDGTILEFPAGTSQDAMRKAIGDFQSAPSRATRELEAGSLYRPDNAGMFNIGPTSGPVDAVNPVPDGYMPPQAERVLDNVVGLDNGVMSAGEQVAAALNKGGESMTLGVVGDEAAGAVDEFLGRRESGTDFYRQQETDLRQNNAPLYYGAEVGGALALPGAGMAGFVGRGANLASKAARGASVAAPAGALYGAMEGETPEERAQGGASGAALGAGLGAAGPVAAQGAGAAWRALRQRVAPRNAASQAAKELGVDSTAARLVMDMADMEPPAAMQGRLARANGTDMLADASPTMQGALDSALRSPGPAATVAMQRVDDRAAQAGANMASALDDAAGPARGTGAATRAIREGTANARGAAYGKAYSQPIDYASETGQRLEALLPRVPQSAIERANRLMQINGEESAQILAQVADDGSATFFKLPDVRQWDYIKRGLDDVARSGDGQGALGGQTDLGRSYQGLARAIRNTLRNAVPEYGAALDTAADAIGRVEGVEMGAKLLNKNTTREMVRDAVDGATGPELSAMREGLRSQIDELFANVRAVATDQNVDARQAMSLFNNLSSPASREKMALVLGDRWPAVEKRLDEAGVALGLRARMAMNSQTFGRQAFDRYLGDAIEPGALRQGQPLEAAKNAAATAMGASREAVQRSSERIRGQVAELLTRPGGGQRALAVIARAREANAIDAATADQLERLANQALLGGSAAPSVNPSLPSPSILLGQPTQ